MALDSPRIAELRRRVRADPSSIAFAQLGEEYRRGGSFDEAVQVCRAGLDRHPGYLSARVTLGRALMELGQFDEAEQEFDLVLGTAPDNLAAIRGVAEISQRRGHLHVALGHYQRALSLARHDPDLEETVAQISRELGDDRPIPASGMSFEQAHSELLSAAARVPLAAAEPHPEADAAGLSAFEDAVPTDPQGTEQGSATAPAGSQPFDFDSLLATLGQTPSDPAPPVVEAWLSGVAPAPTSSANGATDAPFVESPDSPARPAGSRAGDIHPQIEHDLGDFEPEPVKPAPATVAHARPPASPHDPEDQIVLEDLERWLEVLQDARRGSSPTA